MCSGRKTVNVRGGANLLVKIAVALDGSLLRQVAGYSISQMGVQTAIYGVDGCRTNEGYLESALHQTNKCSIVQVD